MTELLPPIPRRIWTRNEAPEFCRWGDGWAVVGPDHALPEGGEAVVAHRGDGQMVVVALGLHVAARVVRHRPDSYTAQVARGESTRYVVAEIRLRDKGSSGVDQVHT